MKNLSAILAGLLFGIGLAASGMTDTQKVIGFLNIFNAWDPDLIFVMGAAVVVTAVGFKLVLSARDKPLFNSQFSLPTSTLIDKRLLLGASLFGVGWGLYGYCPGPAIASISYLSPSTFIFLTTMIIGMAIGNTAFKK